MNSGFYAACAGLIARTDSLDTIANNLANANTTAFRGRHNVFHSVLATAGPLLSFCSESRRERLQHARQHTPRHLSRCSYQHR